MNEQRYDWSFGIQYFIACALGVALLGTAAFFTMWSVGDTVDGFLGETAAWIAAGSLFGALFALGASIGTGLLLKGRGVDAAKWIGYSAVFGATGVAIGLGIFLSFFDPETALDSTAALFMGLSIGLPLGIGQWLALRQMGPAANIWPLVTTIAFVSAFMIGLPLGGDEDSGMIVLVLIGLITGAITALGAVWLLGRRQTAVAA